MVKIVILASLLSLSACQTVRGDFCAISKPVRLSPEAVDALTDAEARALLNHNETGKKLCGWKA